MFSEHKYNLRCFDFIMNRIALKLPYTYPMQLSANELIQELLFIFCCATNEKDLSKFSYDYKNSKIVLYSKIKTYDEWIFSIDGNGEYCLDKSSDWSLGDCFRKTSLIACRDHGLALELASRNWSLTINTSSTASPNENHKRIVYTNREQEYTANTTFTIHNANNEFYKAFQQAVRKFKPINLIKADKYSGIFPIFEEIPEIS